jgi:hypothetical protein
MNLPTAFTIACRYFFPAIVSKRGSTAPASNYCAQHPKICFHVWPVPKPANRSGVSRDTAPLPVTSVTSAFVPMGLHKTCARRCEIASDFHFASQRDTHIEYQIYQPALGNHSAPFAIGLFKIRRSADGHCSRISEARGRLQ